MKRQTETNFNDIKRFCVVNRISLNEFSKATGIERTRVHRLAHARDLLHKLSVKELGKITDAYETFLIDY